MLDDQKTWRGSIELKAVVVLPTYNNAAQLLAVLDRLVPLELPVLVVNDGSTDETIAVVQAWKASTPAVELTLISYNINRGKADALQVGFAAAGRAGFTHAATIDSDGQLDPADIPRLLLQSQNNPTAIVLGVRPASMERCPARCHIGRQFSNLAIYVQTGRRLSDTQCGLRVYPLECMASLRCRAHRYAYEAEIITRASWVGLDIVEVPVACKYFPVGERVSHFRPLVDSVQQASVHARLILRAILPLRRDGDRIEPHRTKTRLRWSWQRLAAWLNPIRAWRATRESDVGQMEFAAAVAIGAWIGTLPFFGLHTALSLYVAWRLHLHPALVVLGSQVSIPPVGAILGIASVWIGSVLLTGSSPRLPPHPWNMRTLWESAWVMLPAWILGSVMIGFLVALIVFGTTLLCSRVARRRRTIDPKLE